MLTLAAVAWSSAACLPLPSSPQRLRPRLIVGREDGLWTVPLDGGTARRLTSPERGGIDQDPALSPDGARLVFSRTPPMRLAPNQQFTPAALPQTSLFIADADGRAPKRLASPPSAAYGGRLESAVWHPDGSALYAMVTLWIYTGDVVTGQHIEIARVDATTGALAPVVPDALWPSIAPDGRRLAYVHTRADGAALYVADLAPDGTRITAERMIIPPGRLDGLAWPRFSPDGHRLVVSAVAPTLGSPGGAGQPAMSGATLEHSGVLDALRTRVEAIMRRLAARWTAHPAMGHGLPMDLFIVAPDGTGLTRLTELLEDEPAAAWSPDGRQIAIAAGGGLYLVSASGGRAQVLSRQGGRGAVAWAAG